MASSPEVTLQTSSKLSANGDNKCGCSTAASVVGGAASSGPGANDPSVGGGLRGAEAGAFVSKHVSALQTVESFLHALTNASRYGTPGRANLSEA